MAMCKNNLQKISYVDWHVGLVDFLFRYYKEMLFKNKKIKYKIFLMFN